MISERRSINCHETFFFFDTLDSLLTRAIYKRNQTCKKKKVVEST